jgi:hypothetical protein
MIKINNHLSVYSLFRIIFYKFQFFLHGKTNNNFPYSKFKNFSYSKFKNKSETQFILVLGFIKKQGL